MNDKRIEKDFIGEKEIDNSCYYGIQTSRAKENFTTTGYRLSPELITALALVKKATAKANMDIGKLDSKIATAIIASADKIIAGDYHDQIVVDPIQGGAGTSINMNLNEVIANLALENLGYNKGDYHIVDPNNHVNMAQSTNDAVPTAGRIALINKSLALQEVVTTLIESFNAKSLEFDGIIKMGRTHLQDAVPIRLGQEFSAYRDVLKRDLIRLNTATQDLYTINIGATAVGTGLNANPNYIKLAVDYLCQYTGYPLKLSDNLVDATQNSDSYTTLSSVIRVMMTNLSKIANDIRLMASGPRAGLYELILPARQAGSSIMPGKINPVMPELINQSAFQIIGNDVTIGLASEAGQFELNVMFPVLIFNLLQSLKIATNSINSFTRYCLQDIRANEDRMANYVKNSIGIVTALNPHIGYKKASLIAKEALESGRPLREICTEMGYLTGDQLDIILNSYNMTSIGIAGEELLK